MRIGKVFHGGIDDVASWSEGAAFTVAGNAANTHRSVRVDRWRYIEWSGKDGGATLIDETNDPHEQTNLVDVPAHAETRDRLKAILKTLP